MFRWLGRGVRPGLGFCAAQDAFSQPYASLNKCQSFPLFDDLGGPVLAQNRKIYAYARAFISVPTFSLIPMQQANHKGFSVTEPRASEKALRKYVHSLEQLHAITANKSLFGDEKINAILRLGIETFHLPIAITSWIEDEVYTVKHVLGPDYAPDKGAQFELCKTYCIHTLNANAATSFHHAGDSAIRNHPCYQQFRLEAYIGAPLIVDSERYGTVNLSSTEARGRPFSENDLSLMQLFANWIGYELSHQLSQQRLMETEENNRLILESAGDGIYGVDAQGLTTFVNPAALYMLGYTVEELIGQPMHATVHHSYPDGMPYPAHRCHIHASFTDGRVHHVDDEVFWRKDGSRFPVDYTSTPIMKNGELVGAVVTFRDITREKQAERELFETQNRLLKTNQQLEALSLHDGLTSIPNRRNFDLSLDREIRAARRDKTALSLVICDIDHFKAYNDEYGHLAGDRCIKEIAQCVFSAGRRPRDLTSRFGGEEFTVLLPQTSLEGAVALAEAIRKAVEELNIPHPNSPTADRVTVSLGVASLSVDEHTSAEDLIGAADYALYEAKQGGRNQVRLALS